MLRKFRIRTRLLISFFTVVLFTLIVGLTAFLCLTHIRNMAVKTIYNVRILNDIYDYCSSVDAGINSLLHIEDPSLIRYVVQAIKENKEKAINEMDKYLEIQEQFNDVFSLGEMQDMINIVDIYKSGYTTLIDEILNLVEQNRMLDAHLLFTKRLAPLYNSILNCFSSAITKNLEYSEHITIESDKYAAYSIYIMLALILLSLIVSILFAFGVTKSIAVPLSELEVSARKAANGELDIQVAQHKSNDEIAYLSQKLQEMLQQLHQAQEIKLEAINTQHEKEKAEESARSKSEFLAKMSHEIRTPMNAITGMAELALRDDMPPVAREHVLTIKQASSSLLSIINDILDFSKIENGKLEIVPVDYQFSSLVNDVINIIRMKVFESNLRFIVFIDSNIPNTLYGDEIRIRQILLNLLSNAVKYTDEGFLSLSIKGEINENIVNLTIDVEDSGRGIKQEDIKKLFDDFVQLDIKENKGIEGTGLGLAIAHGIVKAMNGNIFVLSEYGKGSTFTVKLPQKIREKEKLAAVENPGEKRVLLYELDKVYSDSIIHTLGNLGVECKLINTDIRLYDELTTGKYSFIFIALEQYEKVKGLFAKTNSKAEIILLINASDSSTEYNLSALTMPVHSISAANILNRVAATAALGKSNENIIKFTAPDAKILVVDDIYTNLKVAEGLLQPYKMQIELCKSGAETLRAIKKNEFDIIFMDHMMPDMDGIEATKRIRSWEKQQNDANILNQRQRKTVPIIALTANAVMGMQEMFLEKGFSDFIAKPIDVVKLDEILHRWIPAEKKEYETTKKDDGGKKEKHEKVSSLFTIAGIDTEKGLAMTGGTEEGYKTVLSMFYKDAQERLPLLKKTPSAQTIDLFTIQVHALKSAAASIGAIELSQKAAHLEAAGKAEDIEGIAKNLESFTKQLDELVKNIQAAIKIDSADAENAQAAKSGKHGKFSGTKEALTPLLIRLKTALELQNFSEIDYILNYAGKKEMDAKTREILEHISDDVLVTEFDNAIKNINKLLNANEG